MLDRTDTFPTREAARLIVYRLPALIAKREAARGTDQYELAYIAVEDLRRALRLITDGCWLPRGRGFQFAAFGVQGETRPSRAEAMVAWARAVLGEDE